MNLWKKIKWFLLSGTPAIVKPKSTRVTVKDLKFLSAEEVYALVKDQLKLIN